MRVTAGSLLVATIVLLFADALTAVRMTKDCCCAGMSKMTCPLKQGGRYSCDVHGRAHCSLARPGAGTGAQFGRSHDSRDDSTLTEFRFRLWAPSADRSFSPATNLQPN